MSWWGRIAFSVITKMVIIAYSEALSCLWFSRAIKRLCKIIIRKKYCYVPCNHTLSWPKKFSFLDVLGVSNLEKEIP